ncbi:hypothetical protein [Nitritalea halalkaliphila]|uniref:hypothetical protein n=1 Tax=Nitritalea halalkaliphila TaxID=590849 RepID=UPI00031C63F2|nr:hypothetical protein [Nitritalea halalkaliphila]
MYLDLCSGDERNCIHEEFCACAKKRAEAAAEDAVSDQRKAASEEDDFPDQLAS